MHISIALNRLAPWLAVCRKSLRRVRNELAGIAVEIAACLALLGYLLDQIRK